MERGEGTRWEMEGIVSHADRLQRPPMRSAADCEQGV